jgi:Plexin repeat/Sema domain
LNQEYKVFYIGTNTGRIYKIVQFIQNGESKSTLLDIFEVAQNEAIQVMQISQKRKSLYVSTDHRVKQIDLAMCSRRYDSCFRCVKDPYCGWDESTNSCKPYELGLLQVSCRGKGKMGAKSATQDNRVTSTAASDGFRICETFSRSSLRVKTRKRADPERKY